jgi:hypothetical protein
MIHTTWEYVTPFAPEHGAVVGACETAAAPTDVDVTEESPSATIDAIIHGARRAMVERDAPFGLLVSGRRKMTMGEILGGVARDGVHRCGVREAFGR